MTTTTTSSSFPSVTRVPITTSYIPLEQYKPLLNLLALNELLNIDTTSFPQGLTLTTRHVNHPNTASNDWISTHTPLTTIIPQVQRVISDSQAGELFLSRLCGRVPVNFYSHNFIIPNSPSFKIDFELAFLVHTVPQDILLLDNDNTTTTPQVVHLNPQDHGFVIDNKLAISIPSYLDSTAVKSTILDSTSTAENPIAVTTDNPLSFNYIAVRIVSYTLTQGSDLILAKFARAEQQQTNNDNATQLPFFSQGDKVVFSSFNNIATTANQEDTSFFLGQEYEVVYTYNNNIIAVRGRLVRTLETIRDSTAVIRPNDLLYLNKVIKYSIEFTRKTSEHAVVATYDIAFFDLSNNILLRLEKNVELNSQLHLSLYTRSTDIYLRRHPNIISSSNAVVTLPIYSSLKVLPHSFSLDYITLLYLLRRNTTVTNDEILVLLEQQPPTLFNARSNSNIDLSSSIYSNNDAAGAGADAGITFKALSLQNLDLVWTVKWKHRELNASNAISTAITNNILTNTLLETATSNLNLIITRKQQDLKQRLNDLSGELTLLQERFNNSLSTLESFNDRNTNSILEIVQNNKAQKEELTAIRKTISRYHFKV